MSRLTRVLAWLRRPLIGVALTLAACAALLGLLPAPLSGSLDRLIHDTRLRAQAAPADDRVVIVDIDERSLAAQGRWPWNRATVAELIGRLVDEGGAAVVGMDIVFAEAQREPGQDEALAGALQGRPVVLGYYFTSDRGGLASGGLPAAVMSADALASIGHTVTSWTGYGANLEPLQDAAVAGGFFNPVIDADGVVRSLPVLAEYRGEVYESFVLAVLRRFLGNATLALDADAVTLKGGSGQLRLPLSDGATALVPFAGQVIERGGDKVAGARFRYVSATDVLSGAVDPAWLRGRIVLVGTSAPGLTDLRATPVRRAFPGVEIHATLIAGALGDGAPAVRRHTDLSAGLAVLLTAFVGLGLAVGLPAVGAVGAIVLSAVTAAGVWMIGAVAWANFALVVPVATPLLLVAAISLLNLAAGYVVEGRARRAVAGLFGEYVSPALVDQMMRDPQRYGSVESENREMTILFVDIRGFTRIAETMQPEQLREYINTFLTAMTEVVHRYGGTVDKYIGDAVMAFWGAPVEDARHADHAVATALAMLDEVQRLNQLFESRGLPLMRVGIGVNTGVVRVGDMGSRLRRAYTVIGDAVNIASRFEGLTKQYDVPIIVGEATMTQARGYSFDELGRAQVSGRAEPVRLFTPSSLAESRTLPHRSNDDGGQSSSVDRLNAGARLRL
jgi:adenylate cyclase